MSELLSYRLVDFIAFRISSYQDVFLNLNEILWPWQFVLIGLNVLFVFKRRSLSSYLSFYAGVCCMVVGWFFFGQAYAEILWIASQLGYIFFAQGALQLLYGLLGGSYETFVRLSRGKILVLLLCAATALLPLSYFLPWSKHSLLLFGWGPDQTALGCLGLAILAPKVRWKIVLSLLPMTWLLLQALTVVGLMSS